MNQHSMTLWQGLKEAAVPVIAYQVVTIFTMTLFFASLFLLSPDVGGAVMLAGIGAVVVLGVFIGQALALLRVRTWILLVFGGICWAMMGVMSAAMCAGSPVVGVFLFIILLFLPLAMTGGLWSLETNRALWSTWLPLVFTTGTILVWASKSGGVDRWESGAKWAVWDLLSLPALGATITMLLFYLVTRETHRLALWRRGPEAPMTPTMKERGATRPRLSFLGVLLVAGFSVVLTGATAAVAPYLWRTGPQDGEGGSQSQQGDESQSKQSKRQKPEKGQGEQQQGESEDWGERAQEAGEKMVEAAKQAGGVMCPLATAMLLFALLIAAFWRPVRRTLTVRHLREPLWQVPATTRIENGWRLVEIALGDVGIFPRPGEDAAGLARRAAPALRKLSPVEVHGLEEAAEVADRIRFGLWVGPEDAATMRRFAAWALDTVWERLSQTQQLRNLYREL